MRTTYKYPNGNLWRGYGKKGEFIGFERWGADVPGEESEMLTVMKSFEKKAEKMVVILGSMNEGIKSVKGDTSQMIEKQDVMIEKQDQMLDKQDKSIATGHKIR